VRKIFLALETLKVISSKGNNFVSTTEIHKELSRKGFLDEGKIGRKKLQRLLSDLEAEGYVESKFPQIKGRRPQEWRVNTKQLPYFNSFSEEELISLLTLTSFVPEKYRDLPIIKPAIKAIERLSPLLEEEKKEAASNSFRYLPIPVERFTQVNEENIKLIFQAIISKRGLVVSYAEKPAFEIFPLKIFSYNGILYLSAVLRGKSPKYRCLQIPKLRVLSLTKNRLSEYYRRKFKDLYFVLNEKPFLLKLVLPYDYIKDFQLESPPMLYPTQFHLEQNKERLDVYIVAYTSHRFTSWLLVDQILSFQPPDEKTIQIVRLQKLNKSYADLSFSLKENLKRFRIFKRRLEETIKERSKLIN